MGRRLAKAIGERVLLESERGYKYHDTKFWRDAFPADQFCRVQVRWWRPEISCCLLRSRGSSQNCGIDVLIDDIRDGPRGRPYGSARLGRPMPTPSEWLSG